MAKLTIGAVGDYSQSADNESSAWVNGCRSILKSVFSETDYCNPKLVSLASDYIGSGSKQLNETVPEDQIGSVEYRLQADVQSYLSGSGDNTGSGGGLNSSQVIEWLEQEGVFGQNHWKSGSAEYDSRYDYLYED
jgi:hypothetical protein